MQEIWKKIPNAPNYMVSNKGRLFSEDSNKYLYVDKNKGSAQIYIVGKKKNINVKRLVYQLFVGEIPNKMLVSTKVKGNFAVENLYLTTRENIIKQTTINISKAKKIEAGKKVSKRIAMDIVANIPKIEKLRQGGFGWYEISKKTGISKDRLMDFFNGKTYMGKRYIYGLITKKEIRNAQQKIKTQEYKPNVSIKNIDTIVNYLEEKIKYAENIETAKELRKDLKYLKTIKK